MTMSQSDRRITLYIISNPKPLSASPLHQHLQFHSGVITLYPRPPPPTHSPHLNSPLTLQQLPPHAHEGGGGMLKKNNTLQQQRSHVRERSNTETPRGSIPLIAHDQCLLLLLCLKAALGAHTGWETNYTFQQRDLGLITGLTAASCHEYFI